MKWILWVIPFFRKMSTASSEIDRGSWSTREVITVMSKEMLLIRKAKSCSERKYLIKTMISQRFSVQVS